MKKLIATTLVILLGLTACNTAPAENQYYKEGLRLLNNLEYSLALEQFKRAINEDNSLSDAYVQSADILIPKGQYDEALSLLETGAGRARDKAEIYERIGEIKLVTNDLDSSLENYELSLQADRSNREAIKGKTNALALLGEEDRLKVFIRSFAASELDQELLILKGLVLLEDRSEAIDSLEKAKSGGNERLSILAGDMAELIKKFDTEESYLFDLAQVGFLALDNGWFEVALPITNLLKEENEYYEVGYIYQGIAYLNVNNAEEAVVQLEKAKQLNADDVPTRIILAQSYFKTGKAEKAKQELKTVLSRKIKLIENIDEILDTLLQYEEYELAKQFTDKYREFKGEITASFQLKELITLSAMEKWQRAGDLTGILVEQSEQLDSVLQAKVFTVSGFVNFKNDKKALGVEQIKKAQTLDRTLALSYLYEGLIALDQEDYELAKSSLSRAVDLDFEGRIASQANDLLKQI